MARIYFKGLNEIRAIAALAVMFHHIEAYKFYAHEPSLYGIAPLQHFISQLGKNGVYLFFVLSGFLITYLLLAEKKLLHTIDLKKFYIRRILRIWPLYYLIVLLAFLVLPLLAQNIAALREEDYYYRCIVALTDSPWLPLVLFLLFLPNLAFKLCPPVAGAAHTWSVGLEEQFYLIWPQLIKRIKQRYLWVVFTAIALLPVWLALAARIWPQLSGYGSWLGVFPIHFMAIGALGGWLYFSHNDRLGWLNNGFLFAANTFLLVFMLFFPGIKLLFGVVILLEILFVVRENFSFNLRNRWLDKIGEISYGVYMYHPIVVYLSFSVVHSFLDIGTTYHLALYLLIPSLTLLVSFISYRYFEKPFIRYKNKRFTILKSGALD